MLFPASSFTATSPIPQPGDPGNIGVNVAGLVTGLIGTQNTGNASGGTWQAKATGGAQVSVILVGGVTLSAQTQVTTDHLNFNTVTTSTGIGSTVTSLVDLGLVPKWEASVDLTSLNLSPNTNYALTFNLAQSSLLGSLTLGVLNSFNVAVGDSSGTYVAQILGLTNVTGSSGFATLNFSTGLLVNGPVTATFSGTALTSNAVTLFNGSNTAYSVSNLALNATVPEAGSWVLCVMLGGLAATRRARPR